MFKFFLLFTFLLFSYHFTKAQHIKLRCFEKKKKNKEGTDPILVNTCFIKNFKFISTSYPDYAGRYFSAENEVFVKVKNKYVATKNSKVFNHRQASLLALINKQIQKDFAAYKANNDVKDCLSDIDSIPVYKMDDLEISFYKDEIWFEVHWGLSGACRSVDGTIVTFKVDKISNYLN